MTEQQEESGRSDAPATSTVEHQTTIEAEPSRVWEAWADPERIADWFVERAVGRAEEGSTVTWAWERFGVEVEQEVVAADPPHRLVLRAQGLAQGARVLEVTLEGEGGSTVVRVVESGFSGPGEAEGADSGWAMALAVLKHYVTRYFGRRRSEVAVYAPIEEGCATVAAYYREPGRLARWLTDGQPGASAGSAPAERLVLRDGRTVTGPVLTEAGNELARAWSEVDGILELKAFPAGPTGCMVGLRAMSWGLPQEDLDGYEPELKASVERLVGLLS